MFRTFNLIIPLFLFCNFTPCFSEGKIYWDTTYGGLSLSWFNSVAKVDNNSYVAAGRKAGRIWLFWFDSLGKKKGEQTYFAPNGSEATSISAIPSGGCIAAGDYPKNSFETEIIALCLNNAGDTSWTYRFQTPNSGYASCVITDNSGNFIIGGGNGTDSTGDAVILKLNGQGKLVWSDSFSAPFSSIAAIASANDGYYAAGMYRKAGVKECLFIMKLNINGDTLWTKTFNDSDAAFDFEPMSIMRTADGNLLIAGRSEKQLVPVPVFGPFWNQKMTLFKIATAGNLLWQKSFYLYGNTVNNMAESVCETPGNDLLIAGITANNNFRTSYFLLLDSQGDSLWSTAFSDSGSNAVYSLVPITGSRYFAAGYSDSSLFIFGLIVAIDIGEANNAIRFARSKPQGFRHIISPSRTFDLLGREIKMPHMVIPSGMRIVKEDRSPGFRKQTNLWGH